MMHSKTTHLVWDAPEFIYQENRVDWFWALGILALAGIIVTLITKNFLMTIFIMIATVVVYVFAQKQPDMVHVEISEQGIGVNDTLYPYQTLDAFFIIQGAHGDIKLLLHTEKVYLPLLSIPVADDTDMIRLRNILMNHLDEVHMQEPFSHIVMDRLGF